MSRSSARVVRTPPVGLAALGVAATVGAILAVRAARRRRAAVLAEPVEPATSAPDIAPTTAPVVRTPLAIEAPVVRRPLALPAARPALAITGPVVRRPPAVLAAPLAPALPAGRRPLALIGSATSAPTAIAAPLRSTIAVAAVPVRIPLPASTANAVDPDAPPLRGRLARLLTQRALIIAALLTLPLLWSAAWDPAQALMTSTRTTPTGTAATTGTLNLTLGATNTSANRLSVAITGLYPGDSAQRVVEVTNGGTASWVSLKLTTTATVSSLLDSDATNGVQLTVAECSQSWTETGTSPTFSYTCGGTTTTPVTSRAVLGSGLSLGSTPLNPGTTGRYRLTFTLPTTSPDTAQGASSTIACAFVADVRTAGAR